MPDRTKIAEEGQRPDPVSPTSPLVGLEQTVLAAWLENGPKLQRLLRRQPRQVQDAVRLAVHEALEDAREQTQPAMLTPPTQ